MPTDPPMSSIQSHGLSRLSQPARLDQWESRSAFYPDTWMLRCVNAHDGFKKVVPLHVQSFKTNRIFWPFVVFMLFERAWRSHFLPKGINALFYDTQPHQCVTEIGFKSWQVWTLGPMQGRPCFGIPESTQAEPIAFAQCRFVAQFYLSSWWGNLFLL